MGWLAQHHPDLVPRYERLYARGAYAPKAYQDAVTGRVHELARRFGVGRAGPRQARRVSDREPDDRRRAGRARSVEQLALL